MSHWPGPRLEDWLTSHWGIIDADGEFGTTIRRLYANQLVLTKQQFASLVAMYEPYRKAIEYQLDQYHEEECGSWRDYASIVSDQIPQEIGEQAEGLLKSLGAPRTLGLVGPTIPDQRFQCPECGGSSFGSSLIDPSRPESPMRRYCHGNDAYDGRAGCRFNFHEDDDYKYFLVDGERLSRERFLSLQARIRETPAFGHGTMDPKKEEQP